MWPKKTIVYALSLSAFALLVQSDVSAIDHPFLLWTKDEAAEIKKRIDTEPLAKKQYERMLKMESGHGKSINTTVLNLFKYGVLGDEGAGKSERDRLLAFINARPTIWRDKHLREEQTLHTLRYDVLYELLTPEQRERIVDNMRLWIEFHLAAHKPWHPAFRYDRTSWLPNMQWPRAAGTHLMAAALRDEKLVKAVFHSAGGWKWYFDHYIADGRFQTSSASN